MNKTTVSVSLDSEVVYLVGTVNEQPSEWISHGNGVWSTEVLASENAEYRLLITAYNASGISRTYEYTLSYGLKLVYNRTQADADRAMYLARKGWDKMTEQERQEWSGTLRGAYNSTDLNRVEAAVTYLKDLLYQYGYPIAAFGMSTHWSSSDLQRIMNEPSYDPVAYLGDPKSMERYLWNIQAFRYFAPYMSGEALPANMARLSWEDANDIERFLAKVYFYAQMLNNYGEVSGEVLSEG